MSTDTYEDFVRELEAQRRLIKEGVDFVSAVQLFLEFDHATTLAGIKERNSAILRMKQLMETTAITKVVELETKK